MGVILPRAVGGSATGWQLVDYQSGAAASFHTQAAAGGVCSVQLDQLDDTELWLIDHAVVYCTSSTPTSLRLYSDAIDPGRLLDGSSDGNFDVADWPGDGLQIAPSTSLLAVWSGASDGAVGTLNLQLRVLRRLT